MNVINNLMAELGFNAFDSFTTNYDKSKEITVFPFIADEYKSQVYLVVLCDNNNLDDVVNTNFVQAIAKAFRKQAYHTGEMDRNTSLLILSPHRVDETINTSAKVKIEDDPYYFKKYVLSYDALAKNKADAWLTQNMIDSSLVTTIQEYIGDVSKFKDFKEKPKNEIVYSYLIEVVTKIPLFPMRIVDQKEIHSVDYYLNEELNRLRTKKSKPIDINTDKIERLLEEDSKSLELDELLSVYFDDVKEGE